jgi:hypothetical protein
MGIWQLPTPWLNSCYDDLDCHSRGDHVLKPYTTYWRRRSLAPSFVAWAIAFGFLTVATEANATQYICKGRFGALQLSTVDLRRPSTLIGLSLGGKVTVTLLTAAGKAGWRGSADYYWSSVAGVQREWSMAYPGMQQQASWSFDSSTGQLVVDVSITIGRPPVPMPTRTYNCQSLS